MFDKLFGKISLRKVLWRALRGGVYAALSLKLAVLGTKYGIEPTITTAIAAAIMAALDKRFGVGGLVKEPAK